MLFDAHMHTDFSCDAHMLLPEAMATGEKLGIGIIVTEHWDSEYPTNPEMFKFDLDAYFAKNRNYRSDRVLLGIEVGMQPQVVVHDEAMIKGHPFDEVVASMHCMKGKDMYEPTSYRGLTKEQSIREHLEDSVLCLSLYHDFDTYGHLDYISRYMPYEDNTLYYEDFAELWDKVFSLLVAGDKALEINTRRLGNPQAIKPLQVFYNRFRELGGHYVTLGSDAHTVENIGNNFKCAQEIAKTAGLQIVHFKERQRIIDKEW